MDFIEAHIEVGPPGHCYQHAAIFETPSEGYLSAAQSVTTTTADIHHRTPARPKLLASGANTPSKGAKCPSDNCLLSSGYWVRLIASDG